MSSDSYVCSVEGLEPWHAYLYTEKVRAVILESSERAMLSVPDLNRLQSYSEADFLMQHSEWVEDASSYGQLLCTKDVDGSMNELVLEATGIVWRCNLMPFKSRQDLYREGEFSPYGAQSLALAGAGVDSHALELKALENIRLSASIAALDSGETLRERTPEYIHGETVICASVPVCTPNRFVSPDCEPILAGSDFDPNGIAAFYASHRNASITPENLVHVYRAESQKGERTYSYVPCSGANVRRGQLVKVRLAFRIIEIGKRRSLRTEMREIVILDRSIGQTVAFMDRAAMLNSSKPARITLQGLGPPTFIRRYHHKYVEQQKRVADESIGASQDDLPFASS